MNATNTNWTIMRTAAITSCRSRRSRRTSDRAPLISNKAPASTKSSVSSWI